MQLGNWSKRSLVLGLVLGVLGAKTGSAQAGPLPAAAIWGSPTCAVSQVEVERKSRLRKASLTSDRSGRQYKTLLQSHKANLTQCRDRTWPKNQALWLRLYPNDAKPGVLDDVLDRIVNRGYNQVFVEVFYDGRVLLPVADNPTPWRSVTEEAVKAGQMSATYDLWADAIRKGQERGLKIYGWSFAMNFGYGYNDRGDRSTVLALNGFGETSIAHSQFAPASKLVTAGQAFYLDADESDHLFIDPFNDRARADLAGAVQALARRQPDGMLFDYVRYPNALGSNSFASNVKQLWIYGKASRQTFLNSLPNNVAKQIASLYLDKGTISSADIDALENASAALADLREGKPSDLERSASVARDLLWQIAVSHAYKGVLEFITTATASLTKNKMPVGLVFFPGGNRKQVGAYDARMQPWDRFPAHMERHPMTYGICSNGECVAAQVTEVLQQSPPSTLVCPVLAGTWGQSFRGHASFETQMRAIKNATPRVSCVSHFVYAWIEPDSDRARKAGTATGQ